MKDEITTIEFEYNKIKTKIEIDIEQKFQDAVDIYLTKEKIDLNSVEFIHENKKINLNEKIESSINNINNDNDNIIPIQVIPKNDIFLNKPIKKEISEIKCPKCCEPCRMKIENYLINLFDCKNNHKTLNIELDQFEKMQNEINPIIKCNKCEKENNNNIQFYRCNICKINLCSECVKSHDKSHKINKSNKKIYLCEIHEEPYTDYCINCKLNICELCKDQHMNHKIQSFVEITPNMDEIKEKMKGIKNAINLLYEHIQEIIRCLNNVKENMDIYYDIYNNIINNYDENKQNYEILQNLNDINNDNIIEEINHIINFETKRKGYNILNI